MNGCWVGLHLWQFSGYVGVRGGEMVQVQVQVQVCALCGCRRETVR